jgi:hypothetical protein
VVIMKEKRRYPLLLVVLVSLPACDADFDPPSLLRDLRVLALAADPLEVGPGQEVRIEPVVYVPAGQSLRRQSWSFCPFSAGASVGFACAVPACETPLSPAADGSVTARPDQLALSCASTLSAAAVPRQLPDRLEVLFRYRAEASDGTAREAVARVPFWTDGPPPRPNRPPRVTEVRLAGQKVSAGEQAPPASVDQEVEVQVRLDPQSLDTFVDEAGRQRTEEAIVSFFTSAGRFEDDLGAGSEVTTIWRAEELDVGQDRATLYVVVRDLRGGQTVFGPVEIPIQ